MPPRFRNPPSLIVPCAVAIFGAAYCLFIYLGVGDSVCITAGCTLYKSFNIAGISMWVIGLVAFICLVLLLAAGMYSLSIFMARLFLLGDCVLLFIMAITSPCLSCLGVALLFALTYFLLRNCDNNRERNENSRLLYLWSLLFAANLVLAAREMMPPEPIAGNSEAPVHVYFSPSCSACVEAINNFKFPENQIAYFATAHSEKDVLMLLMVQDKLASGSNLPDALNYVLANQPNTDEVPISKNTLLLRWQLLRNKTTVMQSSGGIVPYITFKGLPISSASGKEQQILQGQRLDQEQDSAARPEGQSDLNTKPSQIGGAEIPGEHSPANATMPANSGHTLEGNVDLFGNSTGFATCTEESPENCN